MHSSPEKYGSEQQNEERLDRPMSEHFSFVQAPVVGDKAPFHSF
jgi:hypothetical protein